MITNNEFGLIVRFPKKIYINILNTFDYKDNVVEINGNKYNLTLKQFEDLKKLIDKNLTELIKISKEQTQAYLNENGLDGYGKSVTILLGGMQIYVIFTVTAEKIKKLGNCLIDSIIKIFIP